MTSRSGHVVALLALAALGACRGCERKPPCPVSESGRLRLSRSLSRVPLRIATRVEIRSDGIYCNGERSALLVAENGVRAVEEKAKAGGRTSFLIEKLKAQLEQKNGRSVLILADAGTPARVVKEVLYTAKEAGCERFHLATRRARAARGAGVEAGCGEFAEVAMLREREGSASKGRMSEGDDTTIADVMRGDERLAAAPAQVPSTTALEDVLAGGPGPGVVGSGGAFDGSSGAVTGLQEALQGTAGTTGSSGTAAGVASTAGTGPAVVEPTAPPGATQGPEPTAPAGPRREPARTVYLSNDDSMSLSSAQRIEYAIARNLPLPREHIRPHELLNYYSFRTAPVPEGETFSVTAELAPGETEGYSLLLAIQGRPVSRDARRPVVLTLLVDVSGSMREAGKIDLLKRGLLLLLEQLKSGDVVNVVAFDQESRRLLTGFRVGQDDLGRLRSVVEGLAPGGSTDLNRGLETAYQAAQETKDAEKGSRVLLITDALANTGVVDERLVSAIGKGLDEQGIRLSGIGVGADFNDSLLDRLTERGRGAYVFLGSEDVVDRVFGEGFVSLIETIAEDVRFRLDLPVSLAMERFYGEEASTVESRVQAIHYFAGTSQVFLSDLAKGERDPEASDVVSLTVRYRDPATSQPQEKVFSFPVAEIRSDPSANLRKARLLMAWADGLAETAGGDRPGGDAAKAADTCTRLREDLGGRARSLAEDADVGRVVELLDTYCSRFRATVAEVPPEAPEGAPRGTVRVTPRPDPGNAGRMTGDVFRAVFLRKRPGIERCYDSALLNDAALGGEVTFLLTINAAGTVSVEVTANSDSLEAAGVTTCVAYRLRSLNFASTPPRGGDFRVRLPYTFIPPAAGAARAAVPIVSPPPTGARAPTPPAPTPPAPPPPASAVAGARWLRLVVILTKGSIHLMASRRVAAEVMPGEATATGVRGRIDIPHRTQRVRDAEAERPAACAAPAVPGEFDDCAYLEYLGELLRSCYGNPEGPVMVPDLEAFSIALGEIQDRASQAFGDGLGDIDAINFEVEDDIPFCQVVALIDFSRFRDFAYDWTADAEFRAGVDEAVAKGLDGVSDVLFEPTVWTAAMRRRLLFPVWGLVY